MVVGTYVYGRKNVAIYASVGTYIINNLVIDGSLGIAVRSEGTNFWAHTQITHNTVWNTGEYAFSVRDAQGADDTFIVANNFFSVGTYESVYAAYGDCWYDMSASGAVVKNNRFDGNSCSSLPSSEFSAISGTYKTVLVDAANPTGQSGSADFMCQGALVGKGAPVSVTGVTVDFDTNKRPTSGNTDIGCYQKGSGAHWGIRLGLKPTTSNANRREISEIDGESGAGRVLNRLQEFAKAMESM